MLKFLHLFIVFIRQFAQALLWLLTALIGRLRWQAPVWATEMGADLQQGLGWLRANPRRAIAASGILFVLLAGSYGAYLWYQSLPKPVLVSYTVNEPPRTQLEYDNAKPNPLTIEFSTSVAPLMLVDKEIGSGLSMYPKHEGIWRWEGDKTLRFTPKLDWPVGQEFKINFDRKTFFADNIRLKEYELKFKSAPFVVALKEANFHQDPNDPKLKKIVASLNFSHPIDTVEFEKRIVLRMQGQSGGVLGIGAESTKFTVRYDEKKLNAYIHSEPLPIPAKDSALDLLIDIGVKSARGGPPTTKKFAQTVAIPGLYSLTVKSAQARVATNERNEPEQILLLETSALTHEREFSKNINAWVLPVYHPESREEERKRPFNWSGVLAKIGPEILQKSEALKLAPNPAENENTETHSFKHQAEVGRFLYVKVNKGVKSFGGYQSGKEQAWVLRVPAFPRTVAIMASGSLLALSGEKKLSVLARDVEGVRAEIGRLLPMQLQHLATQTDNYSSFSQPEFRNRYLLDDNNLTERFSMILTAPKLPPGKAHYHALDLAKYLDADGGRRGVFFLKLESYDPATKVTTGASDSRLIVVTDLGLVVKKAADGSQDIFVQSIHSGEPVAQATIEVLGKNGLPVASQNTDVSGRARLPNLWEFQREKQPALYVVRKGNDLAFLPFDRKDRELDFSRFETGGVASAIDQGTLSAYLFSDRGIYRPGEEIRVGMIVKAADWKRKLVGIPLEAEITDARGLVIKRERLKLSAAGFEELRYTTAETSPTGTYTANLYIVKDNRPESLIGSTTMNVQEFQPDRLKMSVRLSNESPEGWVSPQDLRARINLQNLFGTPAENRRVTSTLTLSPAYPSFVGYRDFNFYDPQRAKEGFEEKLAEVKTDEKGEAELLLGLERFARATYQLRLLAQGFEADGGRGVTAGAGQLVSNMPYLVGFKRDGDHAFIAKDAQRQVELIAINPQTKKIAVPDIKVQQIQIKYVSVLNKNTYKYESRSKEELIAENTLSIPAGGTKYALPTTTPGKYALVVRDAQGQELNRIDYTVAGDANLSRTLEKNAELQLTLNKKDYARGEEIELSIQAPYVGAGLITIERERVHAHHWFKTTTTSSVQKIKLPKDFEGNGYVNVTFIRDPGSEEIYTSPLSYGVAPFSVNLNERKAKIEVKTPDLVKPGDTIKFRYQADRPARMVVFAVDEGILQVARYQTADPLGHFFAKRALEVKTTQILDLILPEFKRVMALAAGGDAEALLGRHLNPFKRRRDKPVAFWSGLLDAGPQEKEIAYTVPDYFNGSLRVMAVAVAEDAVGVIQKKTISRGDFVLSPNVPTTVTPGDEFEISVGVANNVVGSGKDAAVALSLNTSPHLEIIGPAKSELKIGELREGVAQFRLRAKPQLGSASLSFTASHANKTGKLSTDLSVRPAVPFMTQLTLGSIKNSNAEVAVSRQMYAEHRKLEAGISHLPLSFAHGLTAYLDNFAYTCTEQLVSKAIPALILGERPEFGKVKEQAGATLNALIATLRARQNADGSFGLWAANPVVQEWPAIYATHFLIEARERRKAVPQDLLQQANNYLQELAAREVAGLGEVRAQAYAIYLLTRQGILTTNLASSLQQRLEQDHPKTWKQDVAAAYLAATYLLLKQEKLADKIIADIKIDLTRSTQAWYHSAYDDDLSRSAQIITLLAKHFKERYRSLPADSLESLVKPLQDGRYNTLSSAYTILALDAVATLGGADVSGKFTVKEILRDGQTRALPLPAGVLPRVNFTADAAKLRFESASDLIAYYVMNQSGFDVSLPDKEIKNGFEIIREYTDTSGKPIKTLTLGQEIEVKLRFRALNRERIDQVAIVDLLPGGFELVLDAVPTSNNQPADANAVNGDEGEGEDVAWRAPIGGNKSTWRPDYVDLREDRVVLYGSVEKDAGEFIYRLKATNAGTYRVPPAYGEGMYERSVQARSLGAQFVVEKK